MMTEERKRELETKLNSIMDEIRDIVVETKYGYSIMVLPTQFTDSKTSSCVYIHEAIPDECVEVKDGDFSNIFDEIEEKQKMFDAQQTNEEEEDSENE